MLVAAGGPVIVRMLLERGNFNSADAQLVAKVWLALDCRVAGGYLDYFSRSVVPSAAACSGSSSRSAACRWS